MLRTSFVTLVAAAVGAGDAAAASPQWQEATNVPCLVWNRVPEPGDSVTWTGSCVGGKSEGHGTEVFRWLDHGIWKEERYTGQMKGGKLHGSGIIHYANGDRFEGEFADGERAKGEHLYADGGRFVGAFKNNNPSIGILFYPQGARYEGDFAGGRFDGHGTFYFVDQSYYSGDFKNGLPNGSGTLWQSREQFISGTWINGCLRQGTRVAAAGVTKEQCGFQ
jgi:hypothetical protein